LIAIKEQYILQALAQDAAIQYNVLLQLNKPVMEYYTVG
jgi:hypothetical protein